MDRKKFLKKGTIGLTALLVAPTILKSCSSDDEGGGENPILCPVSPEETSGPFPNKTPAELVKENIIGNRVGVPLVINLTIKDASHDCAPIDGAIVDLWQCDAKGNYSQYNGQLDGDFTSEQFLRGRQTTDTNGRVSFISIYPGWYPGRAPHLHLEILSASGASLLVTQIAFSEDTSATVYATADYKGDADTSNENDSVFRDSLAMNQADPSGDVLNGFTLSKTIMVNG